jgi:NitT/TauT family transport system substrate-binding protein
MAEVHIRHYAYTFKGECLMTWRSVALLAAGLALPLTQAAAETVTVGLARNGGGGGAPVFIAMKKGYFAAEGLTIEPVLFEASGPIAAGVVSGSVDFGATGISAGLYNLAGQGALRIIDGITHEEPGFQLMAVLASVRAFDAGLTSVQGLAGHTVGITQLGNGAHYSIALIEDKYGIDPKSVRFVQLQSNANVVSATSGGQVDAASAPILTFAQDVEHGQSKVLAYVGDETPWQNAILFTATKTADERQDMVERFLRALHKGQRDYHNAFSGPDGKRQDGPIAPEIVAIIGDAFGQTPAAVRQAISYTDPEGRLDFQDLMHQIAWFRAQGMVKEGFDAASVIDKRYAKPLPEK